MNTAARRIVPFEETEKEILVVNSRFIGSLAPAASVEEARQYIHTVKARYPDASHHVPAFLIGHGQSVIAHCTDDGEPSGTAGRPALAVLQGSGIGDAVVVVTRYFGGTRLGTGGLVRAYGDAVKEVLRAAKMAEIVLTSLLGVTLDYPHYEPVKRLLSRRSAVLEDEQFAGQVTILARVPEGAETSLDAEIRELTAGRAITQVLQTGCETRVPIDDRLA
jgi:uncharacterized YigZ family protein